VEITELDVLEVIQVEVSNLISEEDLKIDTKLSDIGMDSLDRIELVMELEDEFDLSISDDNVETWEVVDDIVKSVMEANEGKNEYK